MRRIISVILVILIVFDIVPTGLAETRYRYKPVSIDILPSGSLEIQFRNWAANVIDQYYNSYCMHDNGPNNAYEHEFAHNSVTSGYFDGCFREYYFASLLKIEFDYDISKAQYDIVRKDSETDEEFAARMMPFYKLLLLETMEEKHVIADETLDNVKNAGCYTLVEGTDGKMHMVKDPTGVLQSMEAIADAECGKAWTTFAISMVNTMIDTVKVYNDITTANIKDNSDKFIDSLKDAIQAGITEILQTGSDAIWDNELNKLQNNLNEAMITCIANKNLSEYNRVIAYLNNVYNGKNKDFIDYGDDRIFKMAVQSLLTEVENEYNTEAGSNFKDIRDWYAENFQDKVILDSGEIFEIIAMEFINQVVNVIFTSITAGLDLHKYSDSVTEGIVSDILSICSDLCKSMMNVYMKDLINQKKNPGVSSNTDNQNDYDIEAEMTILNRLLKSVERNTEDIYESGNKYGILEGIIEAIVNKSDDINFMLKNGSEKSDEIREKCYDICKDLTVEIVKAVAGYVKDSNESLIKKMTTEQLAKNQGIKKAAEWGKAIEKLAGSIVNTAEKLAEASYATLENARDEKQVSYKAVAMASNFVASSARMKSLQAELTYIKNVNGGDLKEAILNTNSVTMSTQNSTRLLTNADILRITDEIMLQIRYDISGTNWLYEILWLGQITGHGIFSGESKFVKYIREESEKDYYWSIHMNVEKVRQEQEVMINLKNAWLIGWKEEYRTVA